MEKLLEPGKEILENIQRKGVIAMPEEKERKSPVIVLPDDKNIREQLESELNEYKSRFNPCKDPKMQMQVICIFTILERLLKEGQVNTWDISSEVSETYPGAYDSIVFNNVCAIIEDYCSAGRTREELIITPTGVTKIKRPY